MAPRLNNVKFSLLGIMPSRKCFSVSENILFVEVAYPNRRTTLVYNIRETWTRVIIISTRVLWFLECFWLGKSDLRIYRAHKLFKFSIFFSNVSVYPNNPTKTKSVNASEFVLRKYYTLSDGLLLFTTKSTASRIPLERIKILFKRDPSMFLFSFTGIAFRLLISSNAYISSRISAPTCSRVPRRAYGSFPRPDSQQPLSSPRRFPYFSFFSLP